MTDKLYDQLESMACKLLGSLELFLPKDIKSNLSMPLVNMVKNSGHSLLRPIYYPPLSKNIQKGAMRSAPHEDIDMLTSHLSNPVFQCFVVLYLLIYY